MVAYFLLPIQLFYMCSWVQVSVYMHPDKYKTYFFLNFVPFCQDFGALLRPVHERSRRAASMRKVTKECLLSRTP